MESEKVAKKTLEESAAHPVRRTPLRPSKKPEKDEKKQEELIIPVVVKGTTAAHIVNSTYLAQLRLVHNL